jgi:rhodanese-related sulfurtransferase
VFTGDSLFVGDVGRPDLREGAGNVKKSRKDLAAMMFDTLNNVFANLDDDVEVYPAHGPGSLCGKNMSPERWSTIGKEKKDNWAFQFDDKDKFISSFLEGQPFIPQYFPYDVEVNRKGTTSLEEAIESVLILDDSSQIPEGAVIVDARDEASFKKGHVKGAFNIQLGEESSKFETWLGSIINPEEGYYLVTADKDQMANALRRVAKIGYETNLKGVTYVLKGELVVDPQIDLENFTNHPSEYTIVDIRNESESKGDEIFEGALNIPLAELRHRMSEIPKDKPIVVHCAGGYRSAAGASVIEALASVRVLDLSEAINEFKEKSVEK